VKLAASRITLAALERYSFDIFAHRYVLHVDFASSSRLAGTPTCSANFAAKRCSAYQRFAAQGGA